MVVTQRYYPRAVGWLQLAFLWSEAVAGSVLAQEPGQRAAHRQMLELLRTGDFGRSPFGNTLDDRQ